MTLVGSSFTAPGVLYGVGARCLSVRVFRSVCLELITDSGAPELPACQDSYETLGEVMVAQQRALLQVETYVIHRQS